MPPTFADMDIQNTPTCTFKNSAPLSTLTAQINFFDTIWHGDFHRVKENFNVFIRVFQKIALHLTIY